MSNQQQEEINLLNERVKKLEALQRNFRIAMIVVVGFMIYEAFAPDSGSDIIFADKIKARKFELVDGEGTVYGYWIQTDDGKDSTLRLQAADGSGINISSQAVEISSVATPNRPAKTTRISAHQIDNHDALPAATNYATE